MEEGAQEICGGPFIEALILFSRASISRSPKGPASWYQPLRFQWFCTDLLRAPIFLYVSFCKTMSFKELIHFIQVFKFAGIELFIILFKYYPFTTQGISSDGPFISNTRNLCPLFFPLLTWLRGLLILLFFFSKKQFWFHWFSWSISCFQFHWFLLFLKFLFFINFGFNFLFFF